MKGSVSAVMCLAKVKSIVVPFNVVDLETFDTQSRLYVFFMKLRNELSGFTFLLKSPHRRIGILESTCTNGGTYWLL